MSIQVSHCLETCKCQLVHWAYLLESRVGIWVNCEKLNRDRGRLTSHYSTNHKVCVLLLFNASWRTEVERDKKKEECSCSWQSCSGEISPDHVYFIIIWKRANESVAKNLPDSCFTSPFCKKAHTAPDAAEIKTLDTNLKLICFACFLNEVCLAAIISGYRLDHYKKWECNFLSKRRVICKSNTYLLFVSVCNSWLFYPFYATSLPIKTIPYKALEAASCRCR